MTESKKISVIMPCYNAAPFIAEAISSVLAQTHKNLELIVVDDGSTDHSRQVIHSFADERIRYIHQENQGQCAASNRGIAEASGDYIKFFDGDDRMNEIHLKAQLSRMFEQENTLVSCAWGRFYDGNYKSARFIQETVWEDLESLTWIRRALTQKYDMMGAWLWLIPRSTLERAGGWDERLSLNNDFEFSMRLILQAKNILFAPDAKIFYRSGLSDALSQQTSEPNFQKAILATDLAFSALLAKDNSHFTKQLCANRYQEWLFRVYPMYPKLVAELEMRIRQLGGSNRQMDGGTVARFFSTTFGWRFTRKFILALKKNGYKKLPFN